MRNGFSLIELLVVIAIISLMTGVVAVNMNKNKGVNEVEIAALQVVAQLRALQNDSINGKSIDGVMMCQFEFNFNIGDKKYTNTVRDCALNNEVDSAAVEMYLSAKKDNGTVSFVESSPGLQFYFTAPRGDVSSDGYIKLASGTDVYYVCINKMGNIFAQKTACS